MVVTLLPTNELVAVAWLSGVPGLDPTKSGTTLPREWNVWKETGFVQVSVLPSGSSETEVPMISPRLRLTGWATAGQSKSPPYGKANNLLELVRADCFRTSSIRRVELPGDFPPVRVTGAYFVGEPRRIPGDPGSFARYDVDFQIHWVPI